MLKTFFLLQEGLYSYEPGIYEVSWSSLSIQVTPCNIIFLIDGYPIVKLLSGSELYVSSFMWETYTTYNFKHKRFDVASKKLN